VRKKGKKEGKKQTPDPSSVPPAQRGEGTETIRVQQRPKNRGRRRGEGKKRGNAQVGARTNSVKYWNDTEEKEGTMREEVYPSTEKRSKLGVERKGSMVEFAEGSSHREKGRKRKRKKGEATDHRGVRRTAPVQTKKKGGWLMF